MNSITLEQSLGEQKEIFYFHAEGKRNMKQTIELVKARAVALDLQKVVIFTGDGDGAFLLKEAVQGTNITVLAVTFPYRATFRPEGKDGHSQEKIIPKTSNADVRQKFLEKGIPLIQGVMPLWEIVLPGTVESKVKVIHSTFSLISGGFPLCVQAVLMSCDAGNVEPGEEVISMSADTAIVARAANTRWMFHPERGLEIREIICMPRYCTIFRSGMYRGKSGDVKEEG